MRVGIFGILVLISGIFLVSQAEAVTLIPPSLEISLTPGQPTETKIKLYNETSETLQLYSEPRSFTAKGETGQPEFDFEAEPIGLGNWMEVEIGPIILEPGERSEIPVIINTPIDADPGGHYASLFFGSTPPDPTGGGQVSIASKIGTLILGRVDGDVVEAGSIAEFDLSSDKTSFNRLPIEFFVRYENTGNVHLRPAGEIVLKGMTGKQVATIEVNASKGATLPKTIRKYEAIWEKGQVKASGDGFFASFFDEYTNERNNFACGKYTATVTITGGTEIATDTGTLTFWVIPWHIITVWGVVGILAILLLILLVKRYNTWIRKKAKEQK